MADDRSVSIGRDAVGNVITIGDKNRIDAEIDARLTKTALPSAGSVNIGEELAAIRAVLERLGGEQKGKIGRALDDAAEEAAKPEPDKGPDAPRSPGVTSSGGSSPAPTAIPEPAPTVVPPEGGFQAPEETGSRLPAVLRVFAALVVICALAVGLMAHVVSRPSLGQTLRLNAD